MFSHIIFIFSLCLLCTSSFAFGENESIENWNARNDAANLQRQVGIQVCHKNCTQKCSVHKNSPSQMRECMQKCIEKCN